MTFGDQDAGRAPVRAKVSARRSVFQTILGRKGSGKSVLARRFWDTYPYDELVIDPHGEFTDPDARTLHDDELGTNAWPAAREFGDRNRRVKLRYIPDMGSKSRTDNLDRAVGMAFNHRRCHLLIDEIVLLTRANSTPPYMARALHMGRHRHLSLTMCGPRPVDVDPLVISQADYLYVFQLPHPLDRQRVAAVIGYPPNAFDAAVAGLGRYEYLRWDGDELIHFPPVPLHGSMDREARFAEACGTS